MQWARTTLGEVCQKGGGSVQTGPFGSQLHEYDYREEGVPVVMPADIVDGRIDTRRIARITEADADRLGRHKLLPGDIVYGRRGDIGRQALVRSDNEGWLCGTGCLRIRLGDGDVLPEYLHLYLSTAGVVGWMQGQAIGATLPNLNTGILERTPVFYPESKAVQRKAVGLLRAYDDLIANNQRRITLLEAMAEEIYREWFVRMRFPGCAQASWHKGRPAAWGESKLGAIASFTMGQSPSSEFYNDRGEGLPFHQGVGTYGPRFPRHEVFCTEPGRQAQSGDILFSVRAPVGRLNIADTDLILGRGLAAMRHKEGKTTFLYYLLRVVFAEEDVIGNGSIFNSVGKDELARFPILLPTTDLVERFEAVVGPIESQLSVLYRSNEKLKQTRDALIPRLISGKLKVDHLDIRLPPSMRAEGEAVA
jgi:type I restriction enzyme, S subunit